LQQNSKSDVNLKNIQGTPRFERNRGPVHDRLKWTPPKVPVEPLPVPDCPWCGKPIKDIATAITDKETGAPVHFDCVLARLAEGEILDKGDAITYIGGGRFGIVHFTNFHDQKGFSIKKIFEWENKDNRADWRSLVSDRYSET
jgi:hypothetical protein